MPTPRYIPPQSIPERAFRLRDWVGELLWPATTPLAVLGGPVNRDPLPLAEGMAQDLAPVQPGEVFGPPYRGLIQGEDEWNQRWFRVDIPAVGEGEAGRRFLHWRCGGESTVYLDGAPWAGLDVGHTYCPLPDAACTLWLDCGTYMTGLNGVRDLPHQPSRPHGDQYGFRFDGADLALRDEAAWGAYWDLDALLQMLELLLKREGFTDSRAPMTRASVPLRTLIEDLNGACDAWDTGGLPALAPALRDIYARRPAEGWQLDAALVGHTHIDLLHLWPEHVAQRKAVHSFSTALRLLDRYPEFRFLQSQSNIYRAVDALSPELGQAIRAQIAAGRWEATGGMEVEADTHIPCGEALARCLILGQRAFAELRGGDICRTLWMPDVFGYNACLPQLMRLAGLDSFFTTKLGWSKLTRFPHRSFRWRGMDGSEVLAHLSTGSYCQAVEAPELVRLAEEHAQAPAHPEFIVPTGYGDGGGGPNEMMAERARRFADLQGAPKAAWANVEDFFDRMDAVREHLPVYQGELYLEEHRGVFSNEVGLKRAFRDAETALQAHEAARVLTGQGPIDAEDWRRLCLIQFHDAVTGTSSSLTVNQMRSDLLDVIGGQSQGFSRTFEGWANVADGDGRFLNPLPFAARFATDTGPCTRTFPLDALGSIDISDAARVECAAVTASPHHLQSDRVRAEFDGAGRLCRLVIDGDEQRLDGAARFVLHPNRPANFDAWNIDQWNLKFGTELELAPLRVNPRQKGAVGTVYSDNEWPDGTRLHVAYWLYAGIPWLIVRVAAQLPGEHVLLKYHLPTGHRGRFSRFGCPFGSVLRPQLPGLLHEEAMWEVPASRWAAVLDDDGRNGLAMLSGSHYGWSCRDGNLGLSLVRTPTWPNQVDGPHSLPATSFAVGAHRLETHHLELNTAAAADALFMVPQLVDSDPIPPPPFRWDDDLGSLVPTWVVPEEDGYTIRCHEAMGSRGSAVIHLAADPKAVAFTDLLGRRIGEPERIDARTYRLRYEPYQVLSLRVAR